MLEDMRSQNGLVEYNFEDPLRGSREDVQGRQQALREWIEPMTIDIKETGQATKKLVYPVAIFHYGNRQIPVNLIENNSPAISPEVINNSEKSCWSTSLPAPSKKSGWPPNPLSFLPRKATAYLETGDLRP